MEKLRGSSAREAQSQRQLARLSGQQNLGQSTLMQHQLGEGLVQEVKEAIAEAKTVKDADEARSKQIVRHLRAKWHPGMSLIVPAIPWPRLSLDLFCIDSLLWATGSLSHDDVLWC